MKYKVLYDTLINKTHHTKGSCIEFEQGTDEGYIKRLVVNKVITPLQEEQEPQDVKSQERLELEQRASELGISFKNNIKNEALIAKIAKAEQSLESKDTKE
ncbi:hypothetical protein LS68_008100 [Helicobacter sp. MIT 05-5293]|uniref:hypothetical protein n=1 Tax=Helicobacter sp. MIT 05-5293 TaxID=1548149 RepID=UPI00051E0C8D|nr:hypothetical protein [Helicobacter sp. MIT 05-5293]TLD80170.1 hypothetical protein LS68_008100 [Helicobacter sp. MIT 05-5293]